MPDLPNPLAYTAEDCFGGPGIPHGPGCQHAVAAAAITWTTPTLGTSPVRSYVIHASDRRLGVYVGHGAQARFLYSVIGVDVPALRAEAERYEAQEQEAGR